MVVTDVVNEMRNGPFEASFTMVIDEPIEEPSGPGGSNTKPRKPASGKDAEPLLASPIL